MVTYTEIAIWLGVVGALVGSIWVCGRVISAWAIDSYLKITEDILPRKVELHYRDEIWTVRSCKQLTHLIKTKPWVVIQIGQFYLWTTHKYMPKSPHIRATYNWIQKPIDPVTVDWPQAIREACNYVELDWLSMQIAFYHDELDQPTLCEIHPKLKNIEYKGPHVSYETDDTNFTYPWSEELNESEESKEADISL